MLWEEEVEAVMALVAVIATAAFVASHASAALNSNLVEICMLTHTSASRSHASIQQDSVLVSVAAQSVKTVFCQYRSASSQYFLLIGACRQDKLFDI
jgi:hypothetical protein